MATNYTSYSKYFGSNTTSNIDRVGWTWNEGRGTSDIIWTSLTTLFLCSWSVLCVNIPSPGTGTAAKIWRKVVLTFLCAIGPELIFGLAYAQYSSACLSVKLFKSSSLSGQKEWTITHAFYANMGGFVLSPRPGDYFTKSFPVNSEQLHYLISKHYIDFPGIEQSEIRDKNKADPLLRAITIIQAAWFLVNVVARFVNSLAITTLELTACAFILSSVATQICWRHKPADIDMPTFVTPKVDIAQILVEAGEIAARPYRRTPLDFVGRGEWWWSALWMHGRGYFEGIGVTFGVSAPPIKRFENTNASELDDRQFVVVALISFCYFGVFFAGWNYPFPSKTEEILWRAACLTCVASGVALSLMKFVSYNFFPALERWRQHRRDPQYVNEAMCDLRQKSNGRLAQMLNKIRNNSTMHEPELDSPAKAVILTWLIGIFYCSARLYFWVSDFIGLRSLPASAYDTVQWWRILPFF